MLMKWSCLQKPVGFFLLGVALICHPTKAQTPSIDTLPRRIYVENSEKSSHVQGVAIDLQRGHAYFSFTTKLIKTDLKGNILASVTGLTCHLGCIDLDPVSGKLYGSIEYKDDAIGRGILKQMGRELGKRENTFYIGIFDTKKMTRENIDAETGGVMTTVFLPDVVKFYEDTVTVGQRRMAHRFGCSGIDGISIGPQWGKTDGKLYVNVDAAIYGDLQREDNDYQVILQYDPDKLERYATALDQAKPHHNGPKKADAYYYVYTGNTTYGIQNLEYDAHNHYWLAAVYKGKKPQFPNYSLFAIDGTRKPVKQTLRGFVPKQKGRVLTLAEAGSHHVESGVRGWPQAIGTTGIESIGGGYYYISHNGRTKDGREYCDLRLYRWVGTADRAFEEVR